MVWKCIGLFFLVLLSILIVLIPAISNNCTGWCCSSNKENIKSNISDFADSHTKPTSESLQSYCAKLNGKLSGTDNAVNILDEFIPGIANPSVYHRPLYEICRLIVQKTPTTIDSDNPQFSYKNKFRFVGVSGKKGDIFELYSTVYLSRAFLKSDSKSCFVMNGITNPNTSAFLAWNELVLDGIIHWDKDEILHDGSETWVTGFVNNIDSNLCMSEYLYGIICHYLGINSKTNEIRYYVTSLEREKEIYKAYKNETSYVVTNVTSGIHASILKILIPKIQIQIADGIFLMEQDKILYSKMIQFLKTYIL